MTPLPQRPRLVCTLFSGGREGYREASPSGLWRRTANAVGGYSPSRVRIPEPPRGAPPPGRSTSTTEQAPVAQRIEHLTTDQKVWGSNPYGRTLVETAANPLCAGGFLLFMVRFLRRLEPDRPAWSQLRSQLLRRGGRESAGYRGVRGLQRPSDSVLLTASQARVESFFPSSRAAPPGPPAYCLVCPAKPCRRACGWRRSRRPATSGRQAAGNRGGAVLGLRINLRHTGHALPFAGAAP